MLYFIIATFTCCTLINSGLYNIISFSRTIKILDEKPNPAIESGVLMIVTVCIQQQPKTTTMGMPGCLCSLSPTTVRTSKAPKQRYTRSLESIDEDNIVIERASWIYKTWQEERDWKSLENRKAPFVTYPAQISLYTATFGICIWSSLTLCER